MQVITIRKSCSDTNTCPAIHLSDRATFVFQGYITAFPQNIQSGQSAVELPLSLLPELSGRQSSRDLLITDRNTVIFVAPKVTDGQALDQLQLPEGEAAVEIPVTSLPELAKVCF